MVGQIMGLLVLVGPTLFCVPLKLDIQGTDSIREWVDERQTQEY
jgi:hypothetical protein